MGSFRPKDQTCVSCVAGGFYTIWTTREVPKVESAQILYQFIYFVIVVKKKKTCGIKFILLSIFKV